MSAEAGGRAHRFRVGAFACAVVSDGTFAYENPAALFSQTRRRREAPTRRQLLTWAADENILLHAAHFPWPGLRRVGRPAQSFRWEPIQVDQARRRSSNDTAR